MVYQLSTYALADDAVDGGYHVAWVTEKQVGLKLVDERYRKCDPDDLLVVMINWMSLRSKFVGTRGDVAIFEPMNYEDMMG